MQEKQCQMTGGGGKSPNAKTEKLKFATYLIFPRTGASKIKSGVFSAKQNAEDPTLKNVYRLTHFSSKF